MPEADRVQTELNLTGQAKSKGTRNRTVVGPSSYPGVSSPIFGGIMPVARAAARVDGPFHVKVLLCVRVPVIYDYGLTCILDEMRGCFKVCTSKSHFF